MTDRELMQQALEALYLRRNQGFSETYSRMADATITALRERLAQPEQEPAVWALPKMHPVMELRLRRRFRVW